MTEERRLISESRIHEMEVAMIRLEERSKAEHFAVTLAKEEIDRRLAEMNEMRAQINQERGSFLSRAEYESKHEVLASLIVSLQRFQWMITGGLFVFQILIAVVLRLSK